MHGAFKMRKDHLFEEHCRYMRQHSQCRAQLRLRWGGKKTLKADCSTGSELRGGIPAGSGKCVCGGSLGVW